MVLGYIAATPPLLASLSYRHPANRHRVPNRKDTTPVLTNLPQNGTEAVLVFTTVLACLYIRAVLVLVSEMIRVCVQAVVALVSVLARNAELRRDARATLTILFPR